MAQSFHPPSQPAQTQDSLAEQLQWGHEAGSPPAAPRVVGLVPDLASLVKQKYGGPLASHLRQVHIEWLKTILTEAKKESAEELEVEDIRHFFGPYGAEFNRELKIIAFWNREYSYLGAPHGVWRNSARFLNETVYFYGRGLFDEQEYFDKLAEFHDFTVVEIHGKEVVRGEPMNPKKMSDLLPQWSDVWSKSLATTGKPSQTKEMAFHLTFSQGTGFVRVEFS